MQSKLKMTTPMQKPDSVTGQACLSSAAFTADNILLSAGVISRCTAVIVPIVFRQERISTLKSPSFRAFVLLYGYVRKVIRTNSESSLRSELTISSYFLSSCLGVRVLGSKPNQSSRPGNSNTVTTLSCKRLPTRQQKPREPTNQQDSNSTAVQVLQHTTVQQY